MKVLLGQTLVEGLKPKPKPYEVRDVRLNGLLLRVEAGGTKTYFCEFARGRRIKLGRADAIGASDARDNARRILAEVYRGEDPIENRKPKPQPLTWGSFLDEHYAGWTKANHKSHATTMKRLRVSFRKFLNPPMMKITPLEVEQWRNARYASGTKPATTNRDLQALRASLNRAVDWEMIPHNPITRVKKAKVDDCSKVRFLFDEEEDRLRSALNAREARICGDRDSANKWRRERGYMELPDLKPLAFADYLKPMVLISMNTGLRRGELFDLMWSDIDLKLGIITIVGATTKSSKTRHIPTNREVQETLSAWRKQCDRDAKRVFESEAGKRFDNITTSWERLLVAAEIVNFRWHDLRHHFASQLVMAGVDLNTVRELLGHSDIKMTLRYAHLAPAHKHKAVSMLDGRRAAVLGTRVAVGDPHIITIGA
jgi:integrase